MTHRQHRQTVFYTPETLAVASGDEISGELSCAPNARNPRDLDIMISYKGPTDVQPTPVQYKMCVLRSTFAGFPAPAAMGQVLTSCQVLIELFTLKFCCHAMFGFTRIAPLS